MLSNNPYLRLKLKQLAIDGQTAQKLVLKLANVYDDLASSSEDQFLPTPLHSLPSGQELGQFLAVDVGGTNLRVAFIELLGSDSKSYKAESQGQNVKVSFAKEWPIRDAMKMDKADDLFNWIGDCIVDVITRRNSSTAKKAAGSTVNPKVYLGITFSFPMIQQSLSEATLMPMGKGFAIDSKQDLGSLLMAGYNRHLHCEDSSADPTNHLPELEVVAIANDAVSTLVALSYQVRAEPVGKVLASVILATGSNAALLMEREAISNFKQSQSQIQTLSSGSLELPEVIVNTEWTLPGVRPALEELELFTKWDNAISDNAERPGFQPFEYMTAGRWLGELVRRIFVDLAIADHTVHTPEERDVLDEVKLNFLPHRLLSPHSITTKFLAHEVLGEPDDTRVLCRLEEEFVTSSASGWRWNLEYVHTIREITKVVAERSALLIAAATVAMFISRKDLQPSASTQEASTAEHETILVVACTGKVLSHWPGYMKMCQGYINDLVEGYGESTRGVSIVLREAVDGGIIGAGVIAGMAQGLR